MDSSLIHESICLILICIVGALEGLWVLKITNHTLATPLPIIYIGTMRAYKVADLTESAPKVRNFLRSLNEKV